MNLNPSVLIYRIAKLPLIRGSLFLLSNALSTNILLMASTVLIARFYAPQDVGLLYALVSSAGLLAIVARLGFDVGLIRFLPTSANPSDLINSCFTVSSITIILLSLVFIAGSNMWAPALRDTLSRPVFALLFILLGVFTVVNLLQTSIFVVRRATHYFLIQNVTVGLLRLPIVILFASAGLLGLASSYVIAAFLSFDIGFAYLIRKIEEGYLPRVTLSRSQVRQIFTYSIGNQIAGVLGSALIYLLPLLVVNVLGTAQGAYFYIAWAIAQAIFLISTSVSTSLFAEGSNNPEDVHMNARRAMLFAFVIIGAVIILVFAFGSTILLLFGQTYAQNSAALLSVLTLAALPLAYFENVVNVKRVEKRINLVIFYSALFSINTLGFLYLLTTRMGLLGAGYGFLLAQIVTAGIMVLNENVLHRT